MDLIEKEKFMEWKVNLKNSRMQDRLQNETCKKRCRFPSGEYQVSIATMEVEDP